jgi:dolichol-phosphate mannosyltransferase
MLLVVTPIHNESNNIVRLASSLELSTVTPDLWVVVDDGSSDGCAEVLQQYLKKSHLRAHIIRRENEGGLIGGSAFTAWQYGVDYALRLRAEFDYVMKLDADVDLPRSYFERALTQFTPRIGLVGGVLRGRGRREQSLHVPGPVKLYSRQGYEAIRPLPRVVGFDVMDEVAIKSAHLEVRIDKSLSFTVRRAIGASQGLVHGRRRNGVVCRWTGYALVYFALHALRYLFRPPYFVGTLAMIYGFAQAGPGPYSVFLKQAHRSEQLEKLRAALRSPATWARSTYGKEDERRS